jgi:integrase
MMPLLLDQHRPSKPGPDDTAVVSKAFVEVQLKLHSRPTVKLRLAALRMLFDWMVVGQVLPVNPAHAVRGPKHTQKKGKTPVLNVDEARTLIDAIDVTSVPGLRDRALIGLMVYTFARVGTAVSMKVEDFSVQGRRGWVRLHEKGGKEHEMPSSSRSKHEGESSSSLCDRLSRTRDFSQRQLPTDHDYAVPTREYQIDQSSLKPAQTAARPVLERRNEQRQNNPTNVQRLTESLHIRERITLPANPRFTSEWRHNACQPHEGTRVSTGPCNQAIDARSIFLHDPHSNARHS